MASTPQKGGYICLISSDNANLGLPKARWDDVAKQGTCEWMQVGPGGGKLTTVLATLKTKKIKNVFILEDSITSSGLKKILVGVDAQQCWNASGGEDELVDMLYDKQLMEQFEGKALNLSWTPSVSEDKAIKASTFGGKNGGSGSSGSSTGATKAAAKYSDAADVMTVLTLGNQKSMELRLMDVKKVDAAKGQSFYIYNYFCKGKKVVECAKGDAKYKGLDVDGNVVFLFEKDADIPSTVDVANGSGYMPSSAIMTMESCRALKSELAPKMINLGSRPTGLDESDKGGDLPQSGANRAKMISSMTAPWARACTQCGTPRSEDKSWGVSEFQLQVLKGYGAARGMDIPQFAKSKGHNDQVSDAIAAVRKRLGGLLQDLAGFEAWVAPLMSEGVEVTHVKWGDTPKKLPKHGGSTTAWQIEDIEFYQVTFVAFFCTLHDIGEDKHTDDDDFEKVIIKWTKAAKVGLYKSLITAQTETSGRGSARAKNNRDSSSDDDDEEDNVPRPSKKTRKPERSTSDKKWANGSGRQEIPLNAFNTWLMTNGFCRGPKCGTKSNHTIIECTGSNTPEDFRAQMKKFRKLAEGKGINKKNFTNAKEADKKWSAGRNDKTKVKKEEDSD